VTRSEVQQMIDLGGRLVSSGETAVLATLFSSTGSTYRPLGSMMLSGPGTMMVGGVSGGCVEEYVARHGRSLVMHQPAAMLSFEADPDGEDGGKPVLGCGGSIQVLVERCTPGHLAFLEKLHRALCDDRIWTGACLIDTSATSGITVHRAGVDPDMTATCDRQLQRVLRRTLASHQSRHEVLSDSRRVLVHYVPAMTRLVILGAGDDVRPLCTLARSLDWHVTIIDRRRRLATPSRFADADELLADDWATAIPRTTFTPSTAVVLMTHSIADDIEILPLLADKPMAYLGCLGPSHRRQWVLDGANQFAALPQSFTSRLHGPIGLNLGDRSATGIAVSVVSEILASLNGRMPRPLSAPQSAVDEPMVIDA
jgi:xanthine dehydrogenase accessory factor